MKAEAKSQEPKRPRRSKLAAGLCVAALAICTWADLASKNWASSALSHERLSHSPVCMPSAVGTPYEHIQPQRGPLAPIVLINDYLELAYAENCGAAFSMLVGSPSWVRTALFAPAAIAATVGLLWLFVTGYGGRLFAVSVPLIASGALGNLIDRLRFGYVIDFIRFHLRDGFSWPTFNVADSTITVGVVLLLIEGFLVPRAQEANATQKAAVDAASAKSAR